jgi:hypothetical protein
MVSTNQQNIFSQQTNAFESIYIIPEFHEFILGANESENQTRDNVVFLRILPSSNKKSVLSSTFFVGVLLFEDVTYVFQPKFGITLFCQVETRIQLTGKIDSLSIQPSHVYPILLSVRDSFETQHSQSIASLLQKVALNPCNVATVSKNVRNSEQIFNHYFQSIKDSRCNHVLVTGRGSFILAQTLYNMLQQTGSSPIYIELDPSPQLLTESCLGPASVIFPVGCIGLSTAFSSWGFRRLQKVNKIVKTVEPGLVNCVSDNSLIWNSQDHIFSTPLGKLCYYIGNEFPLEKDQRLLYLHYVKLLAASVRLQQVQHVREAFQQQVIPTISLTQESKQLLSRLQYILHVPEYLCDTDPDLFNDLILLFDITCCVILENPTLVQRIKSSEAEYTKPFVYSLPALDVNSKRVDHDTLKRKHLFNQCCKASWETYFFGPLDLFISSYSFSSVTRIFCSLSQLKIYTIINTTNETLEAVNGIRMDPVQLVPPYTQLKHRLLSVLQSPNNEFFLPCLPVSFFIWIQSIQHTSLNSDQDYSACLIGPECLTLEYLQEPSTYCVLGSVVSLDIPTVQDHELFTSTW